MKLKALFLVIMAGLTLACDPDQEIQEYDLIVYGSTSAGIIAAYTAKMKGMKVLLISPDHHLGGLTTGGLGYTDIGNKYAVTGLAKDFYRRVGQRYGKLEQWVFEPSVAQSVFRDYLDAADVPLLYDYQVGSVTSKEGKIRTISLIHTAGEHQPRELSAKVFIDASYEGDLMAKAGVSYTVGRESNTTYNETYNGVQLRERHQLPDGIDPYKVKGDASSGLLWGISDEALAPAGTGDKKLQAYNFRICLTNDPGNRVPITRPEGYDSSKYELLLRLFEAQPGKRKLKDYFIWSKMPNQKTDINNRGGFSTDMIGMNYSYPEGSYEERKEIIAAHESYTKGLLYFYKTDPRVPEVLRQEIQPWGYPKDEYVAHGNWSPQLYVREVRRMVGQTVMTQHHCQANDVVEDGIALAAYTMDSHNCQRVVIHEDGKDMVKNEGNVEIGGFDPYPISYGAIIPQRKECQNLLVPVCLSASHIAYGSIRMEPVFMALGQVAALAAALSVHNEVSIQDVNYQDLQKEIRNNPLSDGSTPEILMDNGDEGVSMSGDWKVVNTRCYGADALEAHGEGVVHFAPTISTPGNYAVYVYFAKLKSIGPKTSVKITSSRDEKEVTILKDTVQIIGQTSGKWVPVGNFEFETGSPAAVEIFGGRSEGTVRADAVLLVPASGI